MAENIDNQAESEDSFSQSNQNEVAILQSMLVRLQADFDNFRKRNASLRQETRDETKKEVLAVFLPIYDNFCRALQAADQDNEQSALRQGLEGIFRQLEDGLYGQGLEVIPAESGTDFDPELHEATGTVPGDKEQTNTIAQELIKGFAYKGTVVRPSQVLVYQ